MVTRPRGCKVYEVDDLYNSWGYDITECSQHSRVNEVGDCESVQFTIVSIYYELIEKIESVVNNISLFNNDTIATHGGRYNTNTTCNLSVHPALKCQVSNSCITRRELSGLAELADISRVFNNTFCALMRELGSSVICTSYIEPKQMHSVSCLHEPHFGREWPGITPQYIIFVRRI